MGLKDKKPKLSGSIPSSAKPCDGFFFFLMQPPDGRGLSRGVSGSSDRAEKIELLSQSVFKFVTT